MPLFAQGTFFLCKSSVPHYNTVPCGLHTSHGLILAPLEAAGFQEASLQVRTPQAVLLWELGKGPGGLSPVGERGEE